MLLITPIRAVQGLREGRAWTTGRLTEVVTATTAAIAGALLVAAVNMPPSHQAVSSQTVAGDRAAASAETTDQLGPLPWLHPGIAPGIATAPTGGPGLRFGVGEGLREQRLDDPPRTVVVDTGGGWVATFTDGARTVALSGPERRFDEATATHGVTSTTWVRVLDRPFDGRLDAGWLRGARRDVSPDVLQVSMEYLTGAPEVRDVGGTLLAGDASYGPLDADGDRPVGSDWHDYQQVVASYGTARTRQVKRPDPEQAGAMDCSGFMRMVWGVRHQVPLTSRVDGGRSLPRISYLQAASAPGVVPVPDHGHQVTDLDRVQPGDLVFFDTERERDRIDHVGMYLGVDDGNRHRFISSRRSIDGPTLGDDLEPSLLDGDGLFARSFVATRRL